MSNSGNMFRTVLCWLGRHDEEYAGFGTYRCPHCNAFIRDEEQPKEGWHEQ